MVDVYETTMERNCSKRGGSQSSTADLSGGLDKPALGVESHA